MATVDIESINDSAVSDSQLLAGNDDVDGAPLKLARALAGVGLATSAMAIALAVYQPPRGVFALHELAYFLTLTGILVVGVMEVWAASCVSEAGPHRHFAKATLCASSLPLAAVIGLGGTRFLMER